MLRHTQKWLAILGLIGAAYILLRFWGLTESCLWFDEIFGVQAAEMNAENLTWFVAQDLIHPPFFYLLLKVWMLAGGESLLWLRTFPLLFSVFALIPFFFLCRELDLNISIISTALIMLAVKGALIKYSQEVRMYSVLFCLSLLSMWVFARFLLKNGNFLILVFVNLMVVYTHYFGWLLVLAEICAVFVLCRTKIKKILTMPVVLLIGYLPWIYAIWKAVQVNSNIGQNIGWIAKPNLETILQFLIDLIEPFYFQAGSTDPPSNYYISIPILITLALTAVFGLINWKNKTVEQKKRLILLAIIIIVPAASSLSLSLLLPYSIWGTRHLIFLFAPLAISLAICLNEIKITRLKLILGSALVVFSVAALVTRLRQPAPEFIWCGWEGLAQRVDQSRPLEIYVFDDLTAYHFWFAVREKQTTRIVKVNNLPGMPEDRAYFLPRGFQAIQNVNVGEITSSRFYVAYVEREFSEKKQPLRYFVKLGYRVGEPQSFSAQGLKGFIVEVWR